jgi:hypothetical protein
MHPIMNAEIIRIRNAQLHRHVSHTRMMRTAKTGRQALPPLRMPRVLAGLRLRLRPVAHRPAI